MTNMIINVMVFKNLFNLIKNIQCLFFSNQLILNTKYHKNNIEITFYYYQK